MFSLLTTFSEVAEERGHEVLQLPRDDLDDLTRKNEPFTVPKGWENPDVLWSQIPCTTFSPLGVRWHWYSGFKPKTEECLLSFPRAMYALEVMRAFNPRFYFLENPVGLLRFMPFMPPNPRRITYCQYGRKVMKPTNIWTNCDAWVHRAPCKYGAPCHKRTTIHPNGIIEYKRTQHAGAKEAKAEIPRELCEEILEACEEVTE